MKMKKSLSRLSVAVIWCVLGLATLATWAIVAAFFRCRDDIRQISQRHPDPIDTLAVEWRH